jgi:MFS family permease
VPFLGWWRSADERAHRAFVAASLGWMLDAFDVMLFSLLLASIMADLNLTKEQGGALGSITLVAAAAGGLIFGVFADRYGRKRALMLSILLYSIFTALCGLSRNLWQLAAFRVCLGLGMGGEWASGAALVSESWPTPTRGRAFAFMQSSWAIGFGLAAIVSGLLLPVWGWRAVFFVGVLPAFFTLWVRRNVEEPELWKRTRLALSERQRVNGPALSERQRVEGASLGDLFRGDFAPATVALTLMNACTLFGWWGLNTWVPAYLVLPAEQGGAGLSIIGSSAVVFIMQVGMWFGYVTFGFVADAIGRKRAYAIYILAASLLLPLYGYMRSPLVLLALGPFIAFFGTGHYSGFGPMTAEIYPTPIRATAQGFTYNAGRLASAAAPFVIGSLAASRGFGPAFAVAGGAFFLAAIALYWVPEPRNEELNSVGSVVVSR